VASVAKTLPTATPSDTCASAMPRNELDHVALARQQLQLPHRLRRGPSRP
jgi:hypothetical protein